MLYMQKLWRSREAASGQKNNPWKQDISSCAHPPKNKKDKLTHFEHQYYNKMGVVKIDREKREDNKYQQSEK